MVRFISQTLRIADFMCELQTFVYCEGAELIFIPRCFFMRSSEMASTKMNVDKLGTVQYYPRS